MRPERPMIFGIFALVLASAFLGAAVYISLVEHPARSVLEVSAQVEAWKPSYKRSAMMRASLAGLGFLLGVLAWLQTRDPRWAFGAVALVSSWPFTLLVLRPTNNILKALYPGEASLESRALLVRWGWLHAVRTVFGVASVALFTWAAIR
jgi:ABC-type sugar transport system permease subunit